ncbi:MAG: DUF1016 family protein [Bacteroidales bacterium]|nr:DUF1016 family protein [Bacteroidales bacterium]
MKENKNTEMPSFVYRDGMTADKDYIEWLSDVKTRFRQCQIKASIRVNTTMLEFYWSIGRDLVALRAEERWGAGVVKQFALDMRQAFPDATGFSHTNVKYMKQWYSFYFEQFAKSHQVGGQLTATGKSQQVVGQLELTEKSQQVVGQLEIPEVLGQVPWGHHIQIISKCKSINEAFFYINKITTEGWSRSFLEHQLASNLYEIQGSAITNFDVTLPTAQSELAKKILKQEYDLSFITVEEVKKEKDLENALANNITRFLLELGRGFSYVGRQMELQMPGGQTYFPDLVFYHIPQHRYVVVELKAVKFIPEFAGKLNFYVTAADKLLRGEGDNPSVGLLICKSTDKTIVEWSLQDIQKPLGVASYQLQEVVERTIAELENMKKHENEKI